MQVDYIAKTLIQPLVDGRASTVEVKEEAEEGFVANIDKELRGTVFSSGCSNWYINNQGRNSASWPGFAATFWRKTFFPKWEDFVVKGGHSTWMLKRACRSVISLLTSKSGFLASAALIGFLAQDHRLQEKLGEYLIVSGQ